MIERDKDLIDLIKNRDESAFAEFAHQWHKRIYNYALRYSNDPEFAQEVVQKTFIQVYQKIHQLKDPASLRPWLYRIASNCCSSEGRQQQRKRYTLPEDGLPVQKDLNTPESVYQKKQLQEVVMETLQLIPEEQRKVILMKEYEGLKFKEIAETLEESENTIKSRMYYGLDAMRKILLKKRMTKEIYYE